MRDMGHFHNGATHLIHDKPKGLEELGSHQECEQDAFILYVHHLLRDE